MLDAADLELACGADGAGALCAECLPDAGGPEASGAGGESEGCCGGGHCNCVSVLSVRMTPVLNFAQSNRDSTDWLSEKDNPKYTPNVRVVA